MGMSKLKKFAVAGGSILLGVVLLVMGFKEFRQSKKLQAEGQQVSGVVTDTDIQRGRKGRRSYYLTVNFKTEAGDTYEARKSVSRSLFDEASEARTVPVVYLPSDPKVVTFGKANTKFGGLIGGVIALVVGGAIVFGKSKDDEATPASPADVEKELLADQSKYDDQQKAA
jgi:hypothetical protein